MEIGGKLVGEKTKVYINVSDPSMYKKASSIGNKIVHSSGYFYKIEGVNMKGSHINEMLDEYYEFIFNPSMAGIKVKPLTETCIKLWKKYKLDEVAKEVPSIIKMIEDNNHFILLENLIERWEQEKDFENWDSYVDCIKKNMDYLDIIKITNDPGEPLELVFRTEDYLAVTIKYSINGDSCVREIEY